jgi:hypothetical protein
MSDNDLTLLSSEIERLHPHPYRSITRDDFVREVHDLAASFEDAPRARQIIDLMRVAALLGERNGHSGVFPLGEHACPLHLYPIRLYEFADGLFVVSARGGEHVQSQVLQIDGMPIDELCAAVSPLVPHDNEWSMRARRPAYLVTSEVLDGLGIGGGVRTLLLRTPSGKALEVEVEPIPATQYRAELDADYRLPVWRGATYVERRDERHWVQVLDSALHLAFNVTRALVERFAHEVQALARSSEVDTIILDLRHNTGGDNTTFGPLLAVLERLVTTIPARPASRTSRSRSTRRPSSRARIRSSPRRSPPRAKWESSALAGLSFPGRNLSTSSRRPFSTRTGCLPVHVGIHAALLDVSSAAHACPD